MQNNKIFLTQTYWLPNTSLFTRPPTSTATSIAPFPTLAIMMQKDGRREAEEEEKWRRDRGEGKGNKGKKKRGGETQEKGKEKKERERKINNHLMKYTWNYSRLFIEIILLNPYDNPVMTMLRSGYYRWEKSTFWEPEYLGKGHTCEVKLQHSLHFTPQCFRLHCPALSLLLPFTRSPALHLQ